MTDKKRTPYVIVSDEAHALVHRVQRRVYLDEGDIIRPANAEELTEITRLDGEARKFIDLIKEEKSTAQVAYETTKAKLQSTPYEQAKTRSEELRQLMIAYISDVEYRAEVDAKDVDALVAAYEEWRRCRGRRDASTRDFFRALDGTFSDTTRDPEVVIAFYAVLRKKHYERCPIDRYSILGGFDVTSGELVLSDPCYPKGTWCAGSTAARNGRWLGFVRYACDWGLRPFVLAAIHADMNPTPFSLPRDRKTLIADGWRKLDIHVGVDSGQAGVFDSVTYRQDTVIGDVPEFCRGDRARDPGDLWYGACCDKTLGDVGAGVIPGGVVSGSGHGDGGYAAYALVDGDVTGVIIDFLGDFAEDRDE